MPPGGLDIFLPDMSRLVPVLRHPLRGALNRLSATPHGAAARFDLWFRGTVCLRKVGGTWWITHEHNSTPFYMDGSFRAALDLRP
jgi:hypothetical protein